METTSVSCAACGDLVEKRTADINRAKKKGRRLFCGLECSGRGSANKRRLQHIVRPCEGCKEPFQTTTHSRAARFCSDPCRRQRSREAASRKNDQLYRDFIRRWLAGEAVRTFKGGAGQISSHIRRYLFEKHDSRCTECGWSKEHSVTKKVPLTVEHKDGDWQNNQPSNLTLLCPNCHALTPTYCGLNRGNGRPRIYGR